MYYSCPKKKYGNGSFKAPPSSYDCKAPPMTSIEGNVYNGQIIANARLTNAGFLLLKNSFVKKSYTIKRNPGVRIARGNMNKDRLFTDYDSEYHKFKKDSLLPSLPMLRILCMGMIEMDKLHGQTRKATNWVF
jgi:hypothetical protein